MALEMTLKLNAPGMTGLHKAGLAGLYLTLRAFSENAVKIKGLNWDLGEKQVILHWSGETPEEAFDELVKKSFFIDDHGFIRLYGLEPEREMTFAQRHFLYQSLLNSFLQFGPHRPVANKRVLSFEIDDRLIWSNDFAPLKSIRQRAAAKDFIDKQGNFNQNLSVAGWLYPGAGQRHVAHRQTKLNESLDRALMLLFAPAGVIYYLLASKTESQKSRLALLIPEIKDLKTYREVRLLMASESVINLTAGSSADAALRMLMTLETYAPDNGCAAQMRKDFSCRAITFGIVPWSEKQKTRTAVLTLAAGKTKGLENYRRAASIFTNKWQRIPETRDRRGALTEPEHFFVTTFAAREMIAGNIAGGKSWFRGISRFLAVRQTREQLYYEGRELGIMVKDAVYEHENERIFIEICHEVWRRRLGELGRQAARENSSFFNTVNKEREKLRTALGNCKNAQSLRKTVVDFWSRTGSIGSLQGGGLAKILPLFDEKNWRKAKDLALLALISYQAPEEKDDTNLNSAGEERQ